MAPTPADNSASAGIGLNEAQTQIAKLLDPGPAGQAEEIGDEAGDEPEALEPEDDAEQPLDAEEGAEEGDEEAEGEEAETGEEEPHYTVKIDGEEKEVSLSELVGGYSRQADYTRKTMELAEERKSFKGIQDSVNQERAQYATLLTALEDQLNHALGQEPDWDTLFDQNPGEASRQKHYWETAQKAVQTRRNAINAERQRLTTAAQQEFSQAVEARLKTEGERLPTVIPEWKDEARAKKERDAIRGWAVDQGLTDEQVQAVDNADVVKILRKAWLYDQGRQRAQVAKPVQAATTLRPGAAREPTRNATRLTRQKQRLAKTGRLDDAAKVIESLL